VLGQETRTEIIELHDDGIVRCKAKHGVRITLEDAKENIAAVARLVADSSNPERRVAVLVDARDAGDMFISREARAYLKGPAAARHQSACAVLVASPVTAVLGHWFVRLTKPAYPMRLFASETEAVRWLRAQGALHAQSASQK